MKTEIREMMGDARVMDRITVVVKGTIRRYGARKVPSDFAADIHSEVVLSLFSKLEKYDPARGDLLAFVGTIAEHATIDALRSHRFLLGFDTCTDRATNDRNESIGSLAVGGFPSPEQIAIDNETKEQIRAYVANLPARERTVYESLHGTEATPADCAPMCERYGLSVNGVRTILCRVRKAVSQVAA